MLPRRLAVAFIAFACIVAPLRAASSVANWQIDLAFLANALTRYHVDPFHSISLSDFERRVRSVAARIPTMSDSATIVAFKQLVASIGDAHTGFGLSSKPPMNFYIFPIKVYRYADGVYIQAATPNYRDLVGSRITSIGDVRIAEAERRLDTVADASNLWTKRWWLPFTFRGQVFKALGLAGTADAARFGLERSGRTQVVAIPVLRKPFSVGYNLGAPSNSDWFDGRTGAAPLYLQHLEHRLWFTDAGNSTLYVRCSIVGDENDETFDAFFGRAFAYADANGTQKVVLDLRMNGGGDNTLTPFVVQRIVQRRQVNRRGHLFVIIGRSTQSAAQNLVDRLQRDTAAVFVGEPTGERPNMYGDPQPFTLPESKIVVNISSLYWQDMGPRDSRDTTGPEIAAELSEDAFEKGDDPAMDAIARPLPPGFAQTLKKAVPEGAVAVREAYGAYLGDPVHRFAQVEAATEDLVDNLVGTKDYAVAEALAEIDVHRYATAPAYDTLGSVAEALKDVDRAKVAYRRALTIDSHDAVAASRLSAL